MTMENATVTAIAMQSVIRIPPETPPVPPWRKRQMSEKLTKKPNPGSREAIEKGCTCPVIDNHHGEGVPADKNGLVFWVIDSCPLHGGKSAP